MTVAQHGTEKKYRQGCRCDECKAFRAAKARESRARKAAWPVAIPSHVHGTLNGYKNYMCRCDECRSANSAHNLAVYHDGRALSKKYCGGAS